MKILCWAVALGLSAPALANWQYTRWGMTPAQVVMASNGKVRQATSEQSRNKGAEGEYRSGAHLYMVDFFFTDLKLDNVSLRGQPGDDCYILRNDLIGLYGKPISEKSGMLKAAQWRDVKKGNIINWNMVGSDYCMLEYSPIMSENAAGL